jgi:peptidoglycan/LPS O-acetylase OafA/YrhL
MSDTTIPAAVEPGAVAAAPTRFTCFDGLRILGMFGVLCFHTAFATGADQNGQTWYGQLLSNAQVAVPMFFVISAFLLTRPFVSRAIQGRSPTKAAPWLRRRLIRVFPTYWFILTFVVLFLGVNLNGLRNAFLYYSLLFPFARTEVALGFGGTAGIADAWFLTTDICFYFMIPLLTWGLIRFTRRASLEQKVRAALLGCAGLWLFGQLFRLYVVAAQPEWGRRELIWPTNWIDFFAIGMAFATISAFVSQGGRIPRLIDWLSRHPGASWGIAGLGYLGLLTFSPPRVPGTVGAEYWFRFFCWGIVVVFIVIPAMFGDQTQGRGRRLLSSKVAAYGGAISYGFYLFHLAVLHKVQEHLGYAPFDGGFVPIYLGTAAVTIVLASFAYYTVEKPTLGLKDQPLAAMVSSLWVRHPKRGLSEASPKAASDAPRDTASDPPQDAPSLETPQDAGRRV